jgi:hypothetical protein
MPKRVIEIPDELHERADVVEGIVAEVRRTVARTGGGKAVDDAQVEAAVSAGAARVERATHRALLQALDVDVPGRHHRGCARQPGRPVSGAVPHAGGLGVDRWRTARTSRTCSSIATRSRRTRDP